jgi:putative FmdB family regulatory protein
LWAAIQNIMPIYEYACSKCEKTFELIQKFSDEPLTECQCGEKGSVHRLVSSPALQFKGSGWYITDYAKSGSGKSSGKSSESKSSEAKTSESKSSDSKPAASSSSDSK